jgi:hypothetical protein
MNELLYRLKNETERLPSLTAIGPAVRECRQANRDLKAPKADCSDFFSAAAFTSGREA